MTDGTSNKKHKSRIDSNDTAERQQQSQQSEGEGKLALRTSSKRGPRDHSTSSSRSKRARLRPDINRTASSTSLASRPTISRRSSARSARHLHIPHTDDNAITSGDEADSVIGGSASKPRIALSCASDEEGELALSKPHWAVRHRIYLDHELLSTTTSANRPGLHKFQDLLLREQLEVRLLTSHNGEEAHFATRHATLRFWRRDGSLAEKWMDKDYDGEKEHEFAMENMNDWTILQLSMGAEAATLADEDEQSDEEMPDVAAKVTDAGKEGTDEAGDADDDDNSDQNSLAIPTMDIISHYISDYHDARNIASAPGRESDSEDEDGEEEEGEGGEGKEGKEADQVPSFPTQITDSASAATAPPAQLTRQPSGPVYHWVEIRRRALEHQLRTYFHCPLPQCFNRGGTCLALSATQHLHVGVKDLTDWSQQIAHAHRSIAATTLALVAKLVDDQVRSQDERLADVGREREDEDDLGELLGVGGQEGAGASWLAGLRPGGPEGGPVELEMLE